MRHADRVITQAGTASTRIDCHMGSFFCLDTHRFRNQQLITHGSQGPGGYNLLSNFGSVSIMIT